MGALDGRVALITGASRGIGLATAVALSEAGATVALNYRESKHQSAETVEEIHRRGGKAALFGADVGDERQAERLVAEVVGEFGRLDIGVSNAAYSDRQMLLDTDISGFRRTVDVTMWGAFYLVRFAARQMAAQGNGGSIVIVSSPHAYIPIAGSMGYNMAKAAVNQMARTAALELAEDRIRVNLITPGWIDTPGERKFFSDAELAAAGPTLPWKRLGQPEDIARGIVFLCDPASDYITGSDLLIDGGITLPWRDSRFKQEPR